MEYLFPSDFPSQFELKSGLISQNIWQHSLVWMARILNDILFVIILFIYFIYYVFILFIYYLFQSTVVIDYTLTNDNS